MAPFGLMATLRRISDQPAFCGFHTNGGDLHVNGYGFHTKRLANLG